MVEEKIIYPDLSFKIIGVAFRVFNRIGFGMSEKYYQKAFAKELEKENLRYEKEKLIKLDYRGHNAGNYFLDFVVDDKIAVELKARLRFGYVHIKQVLSYLKSIGYKLAILIYFIRDGVKYRRIINAK